MAGKGAVIARRSVNPVDGLGQIVVAIVVDVLVNCLGQLDVGFGQIVARRVDDGRVCFEIGRRHRLVRRDDQQTGGSGDQLDDLGLGGIEDDAIVLDVPHLPAGTCADVGLVANDDARQVLLIVGGEDRLGPAVVGHAVQRRGWAGGDEKTIARRN